jgi:hypothetical protein
MTIMLRVELGNFFYFLYIALGVILTLVFIRILKNKSYSYRYWFIFGLIVLNFAIHILKIFIYPYTTVEYIITKISLENICAVSAVLFPFLYFSKNKTLRDYMVMAGIASGIITFFFPVDAMSPSFNGGYLGYKGAFQLETIRFYVSHYLIFLAPFLLMHFKMHTISIHRIYNMPLILMTVLIIIFINEILITLAGWVPVEDFFDPNKRNPSFIFGVKGELSGLGLVLGFFVPAFLRVNPFSSMGFFPVLWLIVPVVIYGFLVAMIMMLIYDREETLYVLKLKKRPILA